MSARARGHWEITVIDALGESVQSVPAEITDELRARAWAWAAHVTARETAAIERYRRLRGLAAMVADAARRADAAARLDAALRVEQ